MLTSSSSVQRFTEQSSATRAGFNAKLDTTLKRIPDLKIGKCGHLQEWNEDYDEPSPGMSQDSAVTKSAALPEDAGKARIQSLLENYSAQ